MVAVIDTATNTIVAQIPSSSPLGVAILPDGSGAYVANEIPSMLSVIDIATDTVTMTMPTAFSPWGLAIMPRVITAVAIDIKPGSASNTINLKAAGVIPAAILSSPTFDASTEVDRYSLSLAGAAVGVAGKSGQLLCHEEDINQDGRLDLVCQFQNPLQPEPGESVAVLTGTTLDGTPIQGQDIIRIVP
jgi:YVTN family beta-propeller protein